MLSVVPALSVRAAADDFRVRTQVGADTTAPSIPQNLTATPVATTQIDLAWGESSDNIEVSGYNVWRDDALLATTSTTTYSDTGLSASTTYTYYVTAFDPSFNYSASSSVATATTFAEPEPPTPTSTPGRTTGTRIVPFPEEITSLEILPERDAVTIRYTTKDYVRSVLRWGRTTSYEIGSLGEQAYSRDHVTRITGLEPGTQYAFSIEGETGLHRSGTMHAGSFTTLPAEDTFPPGNVTGLTATREGSDVVLSWQNPRDADFEKVRIVRSDRFYPVDTQDGWVAYEGTGESVRDENVAVNGYLYYTVFAYDRLGNVSSGAVVSIYMGSGEPPSEEPNPNENAIDLSFGDIVFVQEGVVLPSTGGEVRVDGAKQLTVSIPYGRLPEHLKTIVVTIKESPESDKTLKFLLRVNGEKTTYTGTLAPFSRAGTFPVDVTVFDYKTSQVGYAKGTIVSKLLSSAVGPVGFFDRMRDIGLSYWYAFWFVLLLILLFFLGERIHRREW